MNFITGLENSFEQMMHFREAVGYATATYRSSVPPFISFCGDRYPEAVYITQEMVDAWLSVYPYSSNTKAVFISLIREYTKFLCFLGRDDFIPDDDYSTKRLPYHPFLFSDHELNTFFRSIDSYTGSTCRKRYLPEMVLPMYSRMLYCCGMRPQEPPAILRRDIDLNTGDVYIRQSKRHKDRHIIISEDMRVLCSRYDELAGERDWFFQIWDGSPYTTKWYYNCFIRCWELSGLSGSGVPRPYDLRHAFSSRTLMHWINNGRDVMELLPYLSAYLGHSELTSTLYYIHLLPDKLRKSSNIDWERFSVIYGRESER